MSNQIFTLINRFKIDQYNFDIYDFLEDLSNQLINQIEKFLENDKNPLNEIIEEASLDDFSSDLYENFLYGVCFDQNQFREEILEDQILQLANRTFEEFISIILPIETNYKLNSNFETEEDFEKEFYIKNSLNETEIENIINIQNNSALRLFGEFTFLNTQNINFIKNWKSSEIIRAPKSSNYNKSSIIKLNTKFDPTIYKLINSNPQLLQTLDWRIFEELLADILERFGYEVELTSKTKDGGIDIIAIKQNDHFGNDKYLLQAKRYTDKVQVSPVRELLFLTDQYRVTKSCLATTSSFTSGAWELASQYKWRLELKDKFGILDWIRKLI